MTVNSAPELVIANFLEWWLAPVLKGSQIAKRKKIEEAASLIDVELFKNGYGIVDKRTGAAHDGDTGLRWPVLGLPAPQWDKKRAAKKIGRK